MAPLLVEGIVELPERIDLRQRVELAAFERLCKPLVDRSLAICREALDQIGLGPADITEVVVSGGISHLPFVRDAVGRFFRRKIPSVVHPDEAVALGAGLSAARGIGHLVRGCGRLEP